MKIMSFLVMTLILSASAAQADITTGLIGHWTFNEGSGTTTADSSGSGYNGTLQGGANLPLWIAGNGSSGSGALHFIGNGSSVTLPSIPFQNTFSFSFWIHNDVNTSNYTVLISWGWNINVNYVYNALYFTVDGTSYDGVGTPCINDGAWHNIVATYDGNTQSLYCDGTLVGTSPKSVSYSGSTPMLFAQATGGSGNYTGYLNDVRLYNRVLAAGDIATLLTTGARPPLATLNPPVQTADLFIAQTVQGTGDGSSCANAQSVAWLDNVNNWGNATGQIGSGGGTINLCATISSTVDIYNGGTSTNPLTLFFQPNAKISQPAGTGIVVASTAGYGTPVSYLIIDGGTNGIIENTDNGTAGDINPNTGNPYGNQVASGGIYSPFVNNFEVKNLTIQNLYVHSSDANGLADGNIDFDATSAIYLDGFGSNISIHNNTIHDTEAVINCGGAPTATNFNFYNNNMYNYNHGVVGVGGSTVVPANINIYNNHFGSTANWDTTANSYHHDGIYVYFAPGGTLSGVNIYNNLFDGNWGSNNTAHVALWGAWSGPGGLSNFNIYNNVFIQYPNDTINDGMLSGGGLNFNIYNNTFIGSGVTNSACAGIGSSGGLNFENNILSGCTTFLTYPGAGTVSNFDYNLYANATPGGNPVWGYEEPSTYQGTINTLSVWQQFTGFDSHSFYVANTGLSSSGVLQAGSAAIGVGANLTTVSVGALSSLLNDTGAGNTHVPVARPVTGPWDIGAYAYSATPSSSIAYGDVNGAANGAVSIDDAELVAQYSVGVTTLTSAQQQAAEVDGNSNVDIYDAYLIAEYAVGLITKFPVQGGS